MQISQIWVFIYSTIFSGWSDQLIHSSLSWVDPPPLVVALNMSSLIDECPITKAQIIGCHFSWVSKNSHIDGKTTLLLASRQLHIHFLMKNVSTGNSVIQLKVLTHSNILFRKKGSYSKKEQSDQIWFFKNCGN